MADTGATSPTSATSWDIIGTIAWTNPNNITGSDTSRAIANLTDSGAISEYLTADGFGFSVPTGATIDGILVEWECRKSDMLASVVDEESRLYVDDAIAGDDKASATEWATSDTYRSYGGSSDLWGLTPTVSQINDNGGFGAAISATSVSVPVAAEVNHCRVTVYYTESGGSGASGVQTRVQRARRSAIRRM